MSGVSLANGFKILGVKSAKAIGMGEAFIVQADDPSAIAFNPAGLVQVRGTQVSTGATVMNGWASRESPTGMREDIIDKWQAVPYSFFTSDMGREDVVAGIGVTAPNGLSSEWSDEGFARYVSTYSQLLLIDVNPSLGYKINDYLSIGAGGSYYYSTATLESMVDYGSLVGLPGRMDGKAKLKATGYAFGYNMGVLCKLDEKNSIAATFKSPFKARYEGSAKYTGVPGFLGLGSPLKTGVDTSIEFPAVVVLGYACKPMDRLKLEFNLDWTNWNTLDSVRIDFDDDRLNDATFMYDYENTFAYKFGAEYSVNEDLKLRAGYIYNEQAVPQANWRPSLPDTDSHFVCSGFGYKIGKVTIDGAAQVVFYEDKFINNNVDNNETLTSSSVDGKYENFALAFSLGVTYKF